MIRMKKRLSKKYLIALVVLIIFAIAGFYWLNKYIEEQNLYDTIDENGVFHIFSAEDMRNFLYCAATKENYADMDACLETDIDMEGRTKIYDGNYKVDYGGHFDGQSHTIYHMPKSLFYRLDKDAIVENVILQDIDICFKNMGTGGIAYRNYGKIRNCQVSGRIEGPEYMGGIVSGNFGIIEDCTNYADIISTQTGRDFEKKYHYDGYGAGGIAGVSGTGRSEVDKYQPEKTYIANCENYGSVTAQTLAGGICAYMEDRTNEGAPNLSVQEMIETKDFAVYEPKEDSSDKEDETHPSGLNVAEDLVNGMHVSMIGCKNYGTVKVEQMVDFNKSYTAAAGICGNLYFGDLYHCANLGRVMFSETASRESTDGWVYANKPMAITSAMGLSPSINHVVDCVSLKGTIAESMRRESIMEISQEEVKLWEQGKLPYVSNSWRFQLEEAIRLCSLEPLGVEETPSSKERKNFYQCDEFVMTLPEEFVIEEQYVEGICYALRMKEHTDFEVWLLRKEVDMTKVLAEVIEMPGRMDGMNPAYLIEEVYRAIPNYGILDLASLNLPFHVCSNQRQYDGKRIFMEKGIPFSRLSAYQQEGGHVLGNLLSIPLEERLEEGLRARWILVFTNGTTNIHPTRNYVDVITSGFYPLDGSEKRMEIREGDTLTSLAQNYTGDGGNWKLLADINGIENPDFILSGSSLMIPDAEAYTAKFPQIHDRWFQ